ncbi:MAG: hypothetical protein LBQ00_08890 [Syntrophobacterales bacterium]|nr:hypothetical protein [Syntrophobacterales bacterium]
MDDLNLGSTAAQLAAGGYHSLALDKGGMVWAWGKNSFGQLGDGTKTSRRTPVKVPGLSDVTVAHLTAGSYHSLALDSNGTVWAWGKNSSGQLGNGTKTNRTAPAQVKGLSGVTVTAIAAGGDHSLAIKEDGTALAWGRNKFGQLGDGTKINRLIPTPVVNLTAKALTAGWYHSLAVEDNGDVLAWGRNNNGQLGDGTIKNSLIPVQVELSDVAALTAGSSHSLALKDNGTMKTWGGNGNGQLGDGPTKMRSIPK